MIDLRNDAAAVQELVVQGLREFASSHARVAISSVALYACPWAGWLLLSLDTPEHSREHVATWSPKGWVGSDARGLFCDSVPDFWLHGWRELTKPEWKMEFESGAGDIVRCTGIAERIPAEGGNEAFNEPFFDALTSVMAREPVRLALRELTRHDPFRVGVQMLDSELVRFWIEDP